jgi:hypothetical protein
VRIKESKVGKGWGVWAEGEFQCAKGDRIGTYGPIKFVSRDERMDSAWSRYAIEWTAETKKRRGVDAIPDCSSRRELKRRKIWGPFLNGAVRKGDYNVVLHRHYAGKVINLVAACAIVGPCELVLDYGKDYAALMRQERRADEAKTLRKAQQFKRKRVGKPGNYVLQCSWCREPLPRRFQLRHQNLECAKKPPAAAGDAAAAAAAAATSREQKS